MTEPTGSEPNDRLTLYRLAYDEARRRLDAQEASLDELRGRCGVLISAAAIVTSFLGARFASDTASPSLLVWSALIAFAISVALATWCLLPRRGWAFYFGTEKLIGTYIEGEDPLSVASTYRDLALHLEKDFRANEGPLSLRYAAFAGASVALIVEVVAWLLHLLGVG